MSPVATRLIFGCHSLATLPTRHQALKLLQQAWSLGLRQFDTAPLYSRGYSEALLGQGLNSHPEARLTTKVGCYPVPRVSLTPSLALPLHWIRQKLSRRSRAQAADMAGVDAPTVTLDPGDLRTHLEASLGRLKVAAVDTLLLHEVMPFGLLPNLDTALIDLISSAQVVRLGYGGVVRLDWLQTPLPPWLTVLQLSLPLGDAEFLTELEQFIASHPDHEIRLFGVFRQSAAGPAIAREWLQRYPNCRVLFSCRSVDRLQSNLETLLG